MVNFGLLFLLRLPHLFVLYALGKFVSALELGEPIKQLVGLGISPISFGGLVSVTLVH
jgi:hypothetical protein